MTLKGFLAGFNKSERESFTTTNRTINQTTTTKKQQKKTMLRGYTFYRWLGITSYEYSKKKQQSNSYVDVVAVVVVLITDVFVVVQYTHSCSCNGLHMCDTLGTTYTYIHPWEQHELC